MGERRYFGHLEFDKDVVRSLYELGPFLDETMRSGAVTHAHLARNCKHLSTLIGRLTGGYEGTAAFRSFHNKGTLAKSADNSVAIGEIAPRWSCPHGKLGYDTSVAGDGFHELRIFPRVGHINAAP